MKGMMDSASRLGRFKTQMGLNVSSANFTSGYIALCKIRKALREEFTNEKFAEYKRVNKYSTRSRVSLENKVDKFNMKLERLPNDSIIHVLNVYMTYGIMEMVTTLDQPILTLLRNNYIAIEE